MRMKGLVLCLPLAAILAVSASAQEKQDKKPAAGDQKAAAPDKDAAMKAWMDYMTPGAPHKGFEKMVGKWTVKVKAQMDPGQPAEESEGSAEFSVIMGGRYMEEKFEGKMMGQPFEGRGITAYDNGKKKYVSVWIDSSMTGVMTMTGTMDPAGKVLTSTGDMYDPATKKSSKVKGVMTAVDPDTARFEMWMPGKDGKLWKGLEMTYTRKK
ncbi:MAG: hypothetical protein DIJKHBIC_02273 [Thermoanaerobaculia bacterium]|nr:hypothetical protein [Thermoanaerobaculia bacterium]